MKAIEKLDKLKKELKKATTKEQKDSIKKQIRKLRIKYHITIYDYLRWKRDE